MLIKAGIRAVAILKAPRDVIGKKDPRPGLGQNQQAYNYK
jgi:hypothetical protein